MGHLDILASRSAFIVIGLAIRTADSLEFVATEATWIDDDTLSTAVELLTPLIFSARIVPPIATLTGLSLIIQAAGGAIHTGVWIRTLGGAGALFAHRIISAPIAFDPGSVGAGLGDVVHKIAALSPFDAARLILTDCFAVDAEFTARIAAKRLLLPQPVNAPLTPIVLTAFSIVFADGDSHTVGASHFSINLATGRAIGAGW